MPFSSNLILFTALLLIGCETTVPRVGSDGNMPDTSSETADTTTNTATKTTNRQHINGSYSKNTEINSVWQRIRIGYALPESIPRVGQHRIDALLNRYSKHPKGINRQTKQSRLYLYYVVNEIEKHGLPSELALLPFVESSYNPLAYSSSHAAGLWQFIPNTGKRFKLERNWWMDERRDVVASTQAAITYLKYLHQFFDGDWLLAIAAYNAGEGTVSQAIKRNKKIGKPTDYWSLPLPKETKNYLPKLYAWKQIVDQHKKYSITLAEIPNKPLFSKVDIGSQIDLAKLAQITQVDIDTLYALNPAFKRWATDPEAPHTLLLPIHIVKGLDQALAQYPVEQRVKWHRYRIQRGDTLSQIAQRHNTKVSVVKSANKLRSNTIRIGQTLLIPVASSSMGNYPKHAQVIATRKIPATSPEEVPVNNRSKQRIEHQVQSGDTLWSIARHYQSSPSKIARWNGISTNSILRQQQTLIIWTDKLSRSLGNPLDNSSPENLKNDGHQKVIYRVKKGDNLSLISKQFNVAIQDIRQWNQLKHNKHLQIGQPLRLFVSMVDFNK